jgi:Zn-dependent oligopeptidase
MMNQSSCLFQCEQYSYPYNGKIDFWDTRYYATIVEETRYSVNKEKLRPYFPMERVTQGLLKIYEEILGLNFTEEKEADKWHDDATVVSLFVLLTVHSYYSRGLSPSKPMLFLGVRP